MEGVKELVDRAADLAIWLEVPGQVKCRYKEARPIAATVQKVTRYLPATPGAGDVFYHPKDKELHAVLGDGDDHLHGKWHNALKAIQGISRVTIADEWGPKNRDEWILIKRSAPLGIIGKPVEWAGKLTGGPSPLTNALVGSLLTGGLGYGTGWLLEHLFPERFVRRGRLRKTLGLLGAGLGTVPAIWQGAANYQNAAEAGKPMGLWETATTPHEKIPISPQAKERLRTQAYTSGPEGGEWDFTTGRVVTGADVSAMRHDLAHLPPPSEDFMAAVAGLFKCGGYEELTAVRGAHAGGVGLRSVPMDAFNRAIWNDVRMGMTAARNPFGTKSPWGDNTQQMHTPPQLGAATAGLVNGIDAMYGNQSVLSPRHFIRGLAAAGTDLVTARLVGGVLGALGGLTPSAQEKLQTLGIWGGLIRGTVGSLLGMR
jgi:hypothetical protein